MSRYKILKSILESRKCFKVVCGAGNEDPDDVKRLSMIYTIAGAAIIDVSARPEIVDAAKEGINIAKEKSRIKYDPFINVSVGIKGDPHVRKASIDGEKCTSCGLCVDHCKQNAIKKNSLVIDQKKCIGCGSCNDVCKSGAINFTHSKINLDEVLPLCIERGAENIELHAATDDDQSVFDDWEYINSILTDNFVSMCLDRSKLSDDCLVHRMEYARSISGDRLIIQADGAPMSGGIDSFNSTLQAVSIADLVNKSKIPVNVLISGGTNSRTVKLARMCDVPFNGVSIGTYAREIVKDKPLEKSINIAKKLVRSTW